MFNAVSLGASKILFLFENIKIFFEITVINEMNIEKYLQIFDLLSSVIPQTFSLAIVAV